MRDQTESRTERLQFDDYGTLIGKLVKTPQGQWAFLLEDGFMFVRNEQTGRIRIWDVNRMRLADISKDERSSNDKA